MGINDLICLGLLAMFVGLANATDTSIWGKFNKILGEKKMLLSFESADVFGNTMQGETELFGRNHLSCFTYDNGAAFAKEYRSVGEGLLVMNVTVFYVDEAEDIMCFMVDYPDKDEASRLDVVSEAMDVALQKVMFSNKLQDALKIDDSIYESIDASSVALEYMAAHGMRRLSDSIRLNMNAPETHSTTKEDKSLAIEFRCDVEKNLTQKKLVFKEMLNSYDVNALRRNFGVATSRGELMNSFADAITALSTDFQHRDPCNLENLKISFENDLVLFSLSTLGEDNTAGDMCMAYISSVCAMDDDVVHIFKFSRAETQNYRARSIIQTGSAGNTASFTPYTNAGLTGRGQVVGVTDTGLDESSCYFYDEMTGLIPRTLISAAKKDWSKRKVVQFTYLPEADVTDVKNGHGTHVCGIVAGSNLGSASEGSLYNGVAPDAQLAFMDLAYGSGGLYVPYVNELYPTQRNAGVRIHTNSWGSPFSGTGFYFGADLDQYLYWHTDALVLFAAGNYGYTENHESTMTQQSSSKNVVAVGSSETTLFSDSPNNVAYYSSEGPAYDGRIKPDIVAPGASLLSARSNGNDGRSCDTTAKSGTSMASPAAAGAAALIMQYLRDDRFWAKNCNSIYWFCKPLFPSGLLLKAFLLHSGTAMAMKHGINRDLDQYLSAPPDNVQGYGRIDLSKVLPLAGKYNFDLYFQDRFGLAENSALFFKVFVADTSTPLKVTLSWYDPAGNPLAAKALIHDISMSMTAPDGTLHYGNGGNKYDTTNVNEQLYIPKPAKGKWAVKVFAKALPKRGFQHCAIVITCGGKTFRSNK